MEQNTLQDFSGIPSPSKKNHTPYIDLIAAAADSVQKKFGGDHRAIEPIIDFIIYMSFLSTETEWWVNTFTKWQGNAEYLSRTENNHWRMIQGGLLTPEVERVVMLCLPDLDREKYFPHPITAPTPEEIRPRPSLETKPNPTPHKYKTILEFVTNKAPSINYTRIFILIQKRTKNRFSRRGRKVFPYGQNYIHRELDVSLATVERVFAWLKRQHVIFKRTNENRDRKKCATWFVCTSLKQSTYFLDPKGRRSKKGSPGSPRNRLRRAVHT